MSKIKVTRAITRGVHKGKVETQTPERVDGAFWVEVPITDEAVMEDLVLAKGYAVRMRGSLTGDLNLKRAKR